MRQIAYLDTRGYLFANRFVPRFVSRLRTVVRSHAEMIREHIEKGMRSPKHGRFYYRPGRIHRASAPGESPAIDFKKLVRSLDIRYSRAGLFATIGTFGVKYGPFLEKGTRKMKARPFVAPAVRAYATRFQRAVIMSVARV